MHAAEGNKPVVAVFVSDAPTYGAAFAPEQPHVRMSPRNSPSVSSNRSPLPRYLPLSASSPRPKTFGSNSGSPSASLHDLSSGLCRQSPAVNISSPVMLLGISGSGKKEGTPPSNHLHCNLRKISASPSESVPSRIVARVPRSEPTTQDLHHTPLQTGFLGASPLDQEEKAQARRSPSMRDWDVFDKPSGLRANAADAIAHAQAVLGAQAFPVTAASFSNVDGKVTSKKSPLRHPTSSKEEMPTRGRTQSSAMSQLLHEQQPKHYDQEVQREATASVAPRTKSCLQTLSNFPDLGDVNLTSAPSTDDNAVNTPRVSDLVALYESVVAHDGRSNTGASPLVAQKKTPVSHSVGSKNGKTPKMSPRSSAASESSLRLELRAASESAVKSGSSASVLQLYPQNTVWNQDATAVVRDTYPNSTIHGIAPTTGSSPKSQNPKPPMRTPLKATAADHAHTPVVSGTSVLPRLSLASSFSFFEV